MHLLNSGLYLQSHDIDHILGWASEEMSDESFSGKFYRGLLIELEMHGYSIDDVEKIIIPVSEFNAYKRRINDVSKSKARKS